MNRTCSWNIRAVSMFANAGRNVRGRAGGHELTGGRFHRARVTVGGLSATEVVPVIREIEALYPKRMVVCSAGLTRPSMNIPTSEVAVPRNAELPRTVPLTTDRSLCRRRCCQRPWWR